jgi:hypothetical protein
MASNNLREFNAGLDQFYKVEVVGEASAMVRRVAFAVDRALVMGTPVGNPDLWKANNVPKKINRGKKGYTGKGYVGGRARANWIPTLGTPYNGMVERKDRQGAATIALLAPITADFRLGTTVWISNNLPYMDRLNNGHSTQAPVGFVEMAIEAGIREAMR